MRQNLISKEKPAMSKKLNLLLQPFEVEVKAKLYKYHLAFSIGVVACLIPVITMINSVYGSLCFVVIGNGLYFSLFYFVDKREAKIQQELVNERAVGFIQLANDELLIDFKQQQSTIEKETNISLRFDFYGGRGETDSYIKGLRHTQYSETFYGTSNYLTISTNPNEKIYIYLHDDNEVKIYNDIIMWCYENGIQVDEFCRGERVYGGKKLKYKEIQMFKEKYQRK